MKKFIALLLLLATVSATIHLVTPKNIVLESLEEVEISPVGPGHDVFLKFTRQTPDYVWDNVRLINTVDPDWGLNTYSDHEYVYYIIGVPASKPSGKYTFQFEISDNEGLMEAEIAVVKIFVTHNQDDLIEVLPMLEESEFFADTDNSVQFTIRNKALSRVSYRVTSSYSNFLSSGEETLPHSFLSGQSKQVSVPVNLPEEGEYTLNARVWATDNPTIDQRVSTTLYIKPTISSKLKSIGKGFPLVPVTMAPFYALLGVFGW